MDKTMMYFVIFPIVFNIALSVTQSCTNVEIKDLLKGCDHLIGLNVTTVGGTLIDDHNCDVLLPKQIFTEEPSYQYDIADSQKFYTLMMLDPDAPPQGDGEFFLHLIKSNVPGLAINNLNLETNYGVDFRAYKPPSPSRGSGPHRIMSLLYEQANGNNFLPSMPQSRSRFHLASWLRGKNLCGPVAGTQFRVLY